MEAILLLGDIIALVLIVIWSARNELLPPGSPSVGLFRYPEMARAAAVAAASQVRGALGARPKPGRPAAPAGTQRPVPATRPTTPPGQGRRLAWPPPGLGTLGRPGPGAPPPPFPPRPPVGRS